MARGRRVLLQPFDAGGVSGWLKIMDNGTVYLIFRGEPDAAWVPLGHRVGRTADTIFRFVRHPMAEWQESDVSVEAQEDVSEA